MPESDLHARLVELLVNFAEREFGNLDNIVLYVDSVRSGRGETPQRIGGYVPDLLARDVPSTRTMVGEAKTQQDLETDHSCEQISAFIDFLVNTPNSLFVLCVPTISAPTAYSIVESIRASLPPSESRTIVLDSMGVIKGLS